jgi:hypothetical protein
MEMVKLIGITLPADEFRHESDCAVQGRLPHNVKTIGRARVATRHNA